MTMFTTFTGYFKKNDMTFFSDFIGDPSPFSLIKSTNTTPSYSNTNSAADGVMGVVTITTPTTAVTTYNYGGVYLSSGTTTVDTAFCLGRGECEVEARLRLPAADSDMDMTLGFGIGHNDANTGISNNFVGLYWNGADSKTTARLVVVEDRVTRASVLISGIPSQDSSFNTYSILVNEKADSITVTINGSSRTVLNYKLRLSASGTAINYTPNVEIRDRNASGSGSGNQAVEVDYLRVGVRTNR